MKRAFDIFLSLVLIILLFVPLVFVFIAVYFTSKGPVLYWSKRVGKNNELFLMPKFRTMRYKTPEVATHLLEDANSYLTPIGSFLRRTSIDELPQLYSVLKGDMSFVGPRPLLFNQYDLIELRSEKKIHKLYPGLTGWAQVNGRDGLTIEEKVNFDNEYIYQQSFLFDIKILLMTVSRVISKKGVSH